MPYQRDKTANEKGLHISVALLFLNPLLLLQFVLNPFPSLVKGLEGGS